MLGNLARRHCHALMHYYLSLSQLPCPSRLRDETTAPEPLTNLAHHSINWSVPSFHSLRLVWCLVRKCHPAEVNPHLVVFSPSSRTFSHSLSLLHSRLMPPSSLSRLSSTLLPATVETAAEGLPLSPSLALSLRVKHTGAGSRGGASFLALLILPSPSV